MGNKQAFQRLSSELPAASSKDEECLNFKKPLRTLGNDFDDDRFTKGFSIFLFNII